MYTSIKSISARLDLICMQENESENMDNDNNRNLVLGSGTKFLVLTSIQMWVISFSQGI